MDYLKKLDIKLVDGDFKNPLKKQIHGPEQLFEIFREIKDFGHETLFVVYFYGDLTAFYDIHSHGPHATTLLSIRDLIGRGYSVRARYFALVHNHPSGDPEPSPEDRAIMAMLEKHAGKFVQFEMVDFIIVGDDSYWSLAEDKDKETYHR